MKSRYSENTPTTTTEILDTFECGDILTVTIRSHKKIHRSQPSTPKSNSNIFKSNNNISTRRKKRKPGRRAILRNIDPELKLECLEMLSDGFTQRQCYRHLGIPIRTIKSWQRTEVTRHSGGTGRKVVDPKMVEEVLEWYGQQREMGILPTGDLLRKKALELSTVASFQASAGWLQKFRVRYNLLLDDPKK
jgi:hypothetical protein